MKALIFICFSIFTLSCVKSKEYSDIPFLEFRGFSKDNFNQGRIKADSVIITLFFTDGDGDFGTAANRSETNIFIKDLRTNEIFGTFKAPFVPEEGAGNGISGTIKVKIYSPCCVYPAASNIPPCEKTAEFPSNDLPLEIYIKDRAGNQSNIVKAEGLTLNCFF